MDRRPHYYEYPEDHCTFCGIHNTQEVGVDCEEREAMSKPDWKMEVPAVKVAERLWLDSQLFPSEVLRLDETTAGIIVDVDGVDYILTMQRAPKQRPRPAAH